MSEKGDTNFNPEEIGQSEVAPAGKYSRRTLLKGFSGLLLGTQFKDGNSAFANDLANSPEEPPLNDGEKPIETGITTIKPEGWNLLTDLAPLIQRTTDSGTEVEMHVEGVYGSEHPRLFFKNGQLIQFKDFIKSPPDKDGKSTTGVFEVLPNPESNDIVVVTRETNEGKEVNLIETPVKIDFYTDTPEGSADRNRIWSEVDIDSEVLKKMHSLAKDFDVFGEGALPVFIFQPRLGIQSAQTSLEERTIKIPAKYFLNPEYEHAGLIDLHHEMLHSVHNPTTSLAKEADAALDKEHQNLWETLTNGEKSTEEFGMAPGSVTKSAVWTPFDESTYFPELREVDKDDRGHPFSNYRELFASGMNCMIRKGSEVIDKIEKIENPEDSEQAKRFGKLVLELAYALADDGSGEKGKEVVLEKFQKLKEVSEYFGA